MGALHCWLMERGGPLVDAFRQEGRVFEPRLSRHVGTLGKSFTCSWLSASACKLRHSLNCCGRERLWKAHVVRSAIEIDKYNTKYGSRTVK